MYNLISNIKFKNNVASFQKELMNNVKEINSSDGVIVQIQNSLLYQQPPVPGGWGYYDRVNLTTELNYKLNYTWQITVHDTKYNNIYIHTWPQKEHLKMNATWFVMGAYLRQGE